MHMRFNNNQTYKVALRGGFSDRNGYKLENTEIQKSSLDDRTRIALVNAVQDLYRSAISGSSAENKNRFWKLIFTQVYQTVAATNPYYYATNEQSLLGIINNTILTDEFYDVFSLLGIVPSGHSSHKEAPLKFE